MTLRSSEPADYFDYIVIGGGMAGMSAGFALSSTGRVLVLEGETQPGYHSTGRSAALHTQAYGPPIIRALARGSKPFFIEPPPGFSAHPLMSSRSILFTATEENTEELQKHYSEIVLDVPSVKMLDSNAVRDLVPILRKEYTAAALWDPDAMDLDVHAVLDAYRRGIKENKSTFIADAEVLSLEHRKGEWRVGTRGRAFRSPIIINAAGAWADEIAGMAGARPIGLVAKRRTVILFDPPDNIDAGNWPTVIDSMEQFYFMPDAGNLLGSSADETPVAPCDVQPEEIDVAVAVDRLEAATTLNIRRINHKWAGLRSFVADDSPVVGFDPRVEGFIWLAGQGGTGILTAPALARCCAGIATGAGIPDDLASLGIGGDDLSPERLTRQRAS